MKLALIAHPAAMDLLDEYRLSFHMFLAQKVLKEPPWSRIYYFRAQQRGQFVMLDNGAAELGTSIKFSDVLDAAQICHADEIVLPDALGNYEETLELTRKWADTVPIRKRAMVPQGETWELWDRCLQAMIKMGCATICVPKLYEAYEGGRVTALNIIWDHGYHETHNVHLLGCYENPIKEVTAVRENAPWVRSIDTAAPIAYAQHQEDIDCGKHYGYMYGVEFDWDMARKNLERLITACIGGRDASFITKR